jgi:tRNA(fMet)-specific endonuclease VapC
MAGKHLLDTNIVIALFDGESAVLKKLKRANTVYPDNDIWIGAIALQYELTLVSRDAHFGEIENLDVIAW